MRLTHLGHACLLVETTGARVLLDPGTFSHGFEELTDLDAIVITHQHLDHLDGERLPVLLEANDGAVLLAEPETAAELARIGIKVTPFHPGEATTVGGLTLRAVGGEHALIHPDIPRIGNVGVTIGGGGEPTVFHPGDALDVTPDGVDILGVPLSAPWAALRETVEFVRAVGASIVIPIHDGLLSPIGRTSYLRNLDLLSPEGTRLRDLATTAPTDF